MTQRGVPFQFHIMTGLIGLSSSLVVFGWFRQFTLLFGIHTISVVTILISGFLCLSIGSRMSGYLADRVKKPVLVSIIFSGIMITYILIQFFLFDRLSDFFLGIVHRADPGAFEIGILRFLLTFTFLLVPLILTSGLLPLLVRFFIKNLAQSGRFMGAVILSTAAGAIAGILLSVFVIVPLSGFHALFYAGAVGWMALIVVAMIYLYRKKPKDQGNLRIHSDKAKTTLRFKKKRIVLEAGAKLTRAMLFGSVFQAFTFSSMLLVSIRILINYNYLQPVYFYSLVLGITMVGIVVGSALYKGIADKPANKYLTLATLQILAGFIALITYALHYFFAGRLYNYLPESSTFSLLLVRQTALFSILLLIPAIIQGMSFPLSGRLYPKRLQHIGNTFGHLGSLFFLSLISGIILTPYILIPYLGIQEAYICLCSLILLSGVYLISRDSRLIRGFRIGYAFAAIILFIAIAGTLQIMNINFRDRSTGKTFEGNTASVGSVSNNDGKAVYLNGNYYFGTDADGLKEQIFAATIPMLLQPTIQSAFVAGFGTGITPSILDQEGVSHIYITDVFPEVIRLSAEIFANENNDILTSARVDIAIEDARSYLLKSSQQFDLITSGAGQVMKFPGRYTTDFYKICYQRLSHTGLFCQIIAMHEMNIKQLISACKSSAEVFPHTSLWYISPEKLLLLASKQEMKINYCRLSADFSSATEFSALKSLNISDPETLLAHLIMTDEYWFEAADDVPVNTDDHPFIEYDQTLINKDNSFIPLLRAVNYDSVIAFPEDCRADTTGMNDKILLVNRLLLQRSSLPSSVKQRHVADFFEENDSLFRRYL